MEISISVNFENAVENLTGRELLLLFFVLDRANAVEGIKFTMRFDYAKFSFL